MRGEKDSIDTEFQVRAKQIEGIQHSEAEPLFLQALEIREQRLGVDHPDTIRCRQNLKTLRTNLYYGA